MAGYDHLMHTPNEVIHFMYHPPIGAIFCAIITPI